MYQKDQKTKENRSKSWPGEIFWNSGSHSFDASHVVDGNLGKDADHSYAWKGNVSQKWDDGEDSTLRLGV